jgi:hypothetical protein
LLLSKLSEIGFETAIGFGIEPLESLNDDSTVFFSFVVWRTDPFVDEVVRAVCR